MNNKINTSERENQLFPTFRRIQINAARGVAKKANTKKDRKTNAIMNRAPFFHFISFYFNPAVKPDRTNLQSARSARGKNGFSPTAARPLGRNGNSPFNCFITCSKCLLWPIEIIGREVVDPFVGPFVGAEPTTFSYSGALSSKAAFNGNTSLIIARNSNYAKNLFGSPIFSVCSYVRSIFN